MNGIAAAEIQNLNVWVDVVWAKIMEKYQLGEHEKTTCQLKAIYIGGRSIWISGTWWYRCYHGDKGSPLWTERECVGNFCCRWIEKGFRWSSKLQGKPFRAVDFTFLQTDKNLLQQFDRGKALAYPDRTKIWTHEQLRITVWKEKIKITGILNGLWNVSRIKSEVRNDYS